MFSTKTSQYQSILRVAASDGMTTARNYEFLQLRATRQEEKPGFQSEWLDVGVESGRRAVLP